MYRINSPTFKYKHANKPLINKQTYIQTNNNPSLLVTKENINKPTHTKLNQILNTNKRTYK